MTDPYQARARAILSRDFPVCELARFERIAARVATALRKAEARGAIREAQARRVLSPQPGPRYTIDGVIPYRAPWRLHTPER